MTESTKLAKTDYNVEELLTYGDAVALCGRINAVMGENWAVVTSFIGGTNSQAKREKHVWSVIKQREFAGPRWYTWREFVAWIVAEAERVNAALEAIRSEVEGEMNG